ncbi:hypothetical protein RDI58_024479 [Solanum bulbocastanum]|uniref:Uncharacterized protein n=1 Tax=Solanum bulbocastanum TaxID=147425 RepID=A0AAN8Y3P1_SOLBU
MTLREPASVILAKIASAILAQQMISLLHLTSPVIQFHLLKELMPSLDVRMPQRANLGQDGAVELLVKMFASENLEAKQLSLNALHNLSPSKANIQCMIKPGIVATLLQLLFSMTLVLMTLRESASTILTK